MDEIKIAFETIIVGLMAVPWLLILYHGYSCLLAARCKKNPLDAIRHFFFGEEKRGQEISTALLSIFLITVTYFIGSAMTPLADELLNAPDDCIRVKTYRKFYDKRLELLQEAYHPLFLDAPVKKLRVFVLSKDKGCPKDVEGDAVKPIYDYHKFYVYNHSEHGFELLKQYQSQNVILRGAVLNGLLIVVFSLVVYLFLLLVFRRWDKRSPKPEDAGVGSSYLATLILGVALAVGGYFGYLNSEEEFDKQVVGLYHGAEGPKYFEDRMKEYEERTNKSNVPTPDPTPTPVPTPGAKQRSPPAARPARGPVATPTPTPVAKRAVRPVATP